VGGGGGGGPETFMRSFICLGNGNVRVMTRTISEQPGEVSLLVLKKILGQFRPMELHPIYTPLHRAEIGFIFLTV